MLIQSQHWRHQNNVWNLFKVILNRFYTLFWCVYYWLWTSKCWLVRVVTPVRTIQLALGFIGGLKVSNRKTGTRCKICSMLTINTTEQRQWRGSVVFIVKFEHLYLVFLFLTLNMQLPTESAYQPISFLCSRLF